MPPKKVPEEKSAPKKRGKQKKTKGAAPNIDDDDAMVANKALVAEVIEDARRMHISNSGLGPPPSLGNFTRYSCKNVHVVVPASVQIHRC